jgi:hypothetical protein
LIKTERKIKQKKQIVHHNLEGKIMSKNDNGGTDVNMIDKAAANSVY